MSGSRKYAFAWLLLLYVMGGAGDGFAQQSIEVNVAVEKQAVMVGEPFLYRITVEGTNDVNPPNLGAVATDFDVEFLKSGSKNSQFINEINGRRTEVIRRAQVMDYRLRPKKTGSLVIPATDVQAGGNTFRTRALPISVSEPKSTEDFFLRSELSKTTCYVGEAVYLTTTLEFSKRVRDVHYDMPVLNIPALTAKPVIPDNGDFEFEIQGERAVLVQGKTMRDGTSFVTLTLQHLLIPGAPGNIKIPASSVSAEGATGRQMRRGGFFGGTQIEYAPVVVTAEPQTLRVKPVPAQGKPADYSGLVGQFSLAATATPTEVNVGDPITLSVRISGSPNLAPFELPLDKQPALAEGFRISEDMGDGVVEGESKRFQQTIRVQSPEVSKIPPITLSYFDTASGTYETAASAPIPLTVHDAHVVTASDAEGYGTAPELVEHLAVNEGIAHNFTGAAALKPQRFGPDVWLQTTGSWLFLLVPPFLYGMLAAGLFFRARGGLFAGGRGQRQALPAFERCINDLDADSDVHGPALDALRTYLGMRLERPGNALTYADVEPHLKVRGVADATLESLRQLFDACEAHRYAGGGGAPTENDAFKSEVIDCVRAMDKELKR